MSELSPLTSTSDSWTGVDASIFAEGGSTDPTTDPNATAAALADAADPTAVSVSLRGSNPVPSTGAYDATGATSGGGTFASGDPAAQIEQALAAGDPATAANELLSEASSAEPTADAEVIDRALPAMVYDASGSLLDGSSGSYGVNLFG